MTHEVVAVLGAELTPQLPGTNSHFHSTQVMIPLILTFRERMSSGF